MYQVSIQEINDLRKKTGSGFLDCKKALVESNGDLKKAIEYLRRKGMEVAHKRSDREAKEGVVLACISDDFKKGVIISLNSESDFVANNEKFRALALSISKKALLCDDLDALLAMPFEENNTMSIENKLNEQTGVLGEKLKIAAFEKIEAPYVASYTHHNQKGSSLVGFSSYIKGIEEIGKNIAMQIFAMNAIGINKENLPKDVVEDEKNFITGELEKEGKPAAIMENIIKGRMNKFYAKNTLLAQEYIKDPSINIETYIKNFHSDLKVLSFKKISI